jgi:hypothetical protein
MEMPEDCFECPFGIIDDTDQTDKELDIETLEGTMHASVGDYIITGVRGEKYPCKPDIFEQTYEPADVSTSSPWHRVEEELPPKATWVLTVATDGNVKLFNIATVDAGGQWWTCSPQNILRELYGVRYWMPIEPPKEDA